MGGSHGKKDPCSGILKYFCKVIPVRFCCMRMKSWYRKWAVRHPNNCLFTLCPCLPRPCSPEHEKQENNNSLMDGGERDIGCSPGHSPVRHACLSPQSPYRPMPSHAASGIPQLPPPLTVCLNLYRNTLDVGG